MYLTQYSNIIGLLKLRLMRRTTKVPAISSSLKKKILPVIPTIYFIWTIQYKATLCFSPNGK